MTQRKLTEGEIEKLKQARSAIGDVLIPTYDDQGRYWVDVRNSLDDKIKHGTSDGNPWVDPEPPIPEGYRKAQKHEYRRNDVQYWEASKSEWRPRPEPGGSPFYKEIHYIVPIDPPLTDQDACVWPRLRVMVRDHESKPWLGPYRYQGKSDDSAFPFIADSGLDVDRVWKQARRATPEEIEAANGNS